MINEVLIKRKPGFQKGQKANPNGRPIGSYTETKKRFIEIQQIAAGKAPEMFALLENAIQAGESWAHQIYWKELFQVPKRFLEDRAIIPSLSDDKVHDMNEHIKAFTAALDQFEDFTRDEILTTLKVLNGIKANEIIASQPESQRLNREELYDYIQKLEIVNEHMKPANMEQIDESS